MLTYGDTSGLYRVPTPLPDITITFLVVGERGIRMTHTDNVWYGVHLESNGGQWAVQVQIVHRTLNSFDQDPQRRYGRDSRGEFDAVVICYDPRSQRQSFELVWTKVCPGLLLRHKCTEIIGH
jgi:hypothetical protein